MSLIMTYVPQTNNNNPVGYIVNTSIDLSRVLCIASDSFTIDDTLLILYSPSPPFHPKYKFS